MRNVESGRLGNGGFVRFKEHRAIPGHDPQGIRDRQCILAFSGSLVFDPSQFQLRFGSGAEKEPFPFPAYAQSFDHETGGGRMRILFYAQFRDSHALILAHTRYPVNIPSIIMICPDILIGYQSSSRATLRAILKVRNVWAP